MGLPGPKPLYLNDFSWYLLEPLFTHSSSFKEIALAIADVVCSIDIQQLGKSFSE